MFFSGLNFRELIWNAKSLKIDITFFPGIFWKIQKTLYWLEVKYSKSLHKPSILTVGTCWTPLVLISVTYYCFLKGHGIKICQLRQPERGNLWTATNYKTFLIFIFNKGDVNASLPRRKSGPLLFTLYREKLVMPSAMEGVKPALFAPPDVGIWN
jgi:hypothetical protein